MEGEETPSLPRKVSIFCVRAVLIRCLLEFRDIIVADIAPQLCIYVVNDHYGELRLMHEKTDFLKNTKLGEFLGPFVMILKTLNIK